MRRNSTLYRLGNRRGVAALEFAFMLPLLASLFCLLADFGLMLRARIALAHAVSSGAEYAILAGSAAAAQDVTAAVQVSTKLSPLPSVTVAGPACYCAGGGAAVILSPAVCGGQCPDGNGVGSYVTLQARYTYAPITPFYAQVASTDIRESVTVRLR
jgi:hypothetical protein